MSPSSRNHKKTSTGRLTALPVASQPHPYPFSAIVGQEEMKLALILNVIDPLIGGALVMGHRGTGKSTAVRALADLLPQITVVAGCPFNCDPKDEAACCIQCQERIGSNQKPVAQLKPIPVVELPLGATEDRVCGTLAIEHALRDGVKKFEPGLLAQANRGFLYIDEVNLLEDHLVDLLLDVAATGRNRVEREGVSIEHPSRFVLVGSGNPEEGELRPQLLDRFGLHAEVKTTTDLNQRMTVVERREAYDRNPEEFRRTFAEQQNKLRDRIIHARKTFTKVKLERSLLLRIVEMCVELGVDGHRGELTLMRAARALTAFDGRKKVTEEDVRSVAAMSLRHRLRHDAFEETASDETISEVFDQKQNHRSESRNGESPDRTVTDEERRGTIKASVSFKLPSAPSKAPSSPANGFSKLRVETEKKREIATGNSSSRNNLSKRRNNSHNDRGRHTRSVISPNGARKIALAATIRALAGLVTPEVRSRQSFTPVLPDSLRYKRFAQKQGTLFIFAIDASGSMAMKRIALAKRVMLERLRQSYVNRDRIAIISFRGDAAQLALPPTRSILRARRVVDSITIGGGTPLAAGLTCTLKLLQSLKDEHGRAVVLLFTDGHANIPLRAHEGVSRQQSIKLELQRLSVAIQKTRARILVVDTQQPFESSDETIEVAKILNGKYFKLGT